MRETDHMTKQVAVLIVAAGRGSRLSSGADSLPKQYLDLGGKPVLTRTMQVFLDHPCVNQVLVVRHRDDQTLYDHAVSKLASYPQARLLPSTVGGETRQASVYAGLQALQVTNPCHVLIHDAARPFVSEVSISRVIDALEDGERAALSAVPVFDTLKRVVADTGRLETVDRSGLWAAQTPQGFRYTDILAAHSAALQQGRQDFTDDTAVAEWANHRIALVDGSPDNFKITTRDDLDRARRRLTMATQTASLADLQDIRTGTGYDVHAFDEGNAVILGGVEIPHDRKLKGHSDADVVLHAITDAVLGAIADGDIGMHFPPSDQKWKGAASDRFLIDAIDRVKALGGRLAHVDATVICEEPKIGPHRPAIRESIARICGLPIGRVSIKATTSESLGFTGRREGIAAMAAVTVRLPFGQEDLS